MCVTRVGKVVSAAKRKGAVEFFDGGTLDGVDLSAVDAKEGSYVEVFAGMALSVLSATEAKSRRAAWQEVRRAAYSAGSRRGP